MSWDDFEDEDFLQFAKFRDAQPGETMFPDNLKPSVLYCEIIGEKPIKFKNRWGKDQFKIRVNVLDYLPSFHSHYKDIKELNSATDNWLAGGIRLFTVLKKVKDYPRVKITRIGKGFDTEYFGTEFIFKIQKKLTKKTANPKKK